MIFSYQWQAVTFNHVLDFEMQEYAYTISDIMVSIFNILRRNGKCVVYS